jgi:hypothetical protein
MKVIPEPGTGHISRHSVSMVVTSILLVGRPSSSAQIVFCFETKIARLNGMGQLCLSQRDGSVYQIHCGFGQYSLNPHSRIRIQAFW